MADKKKSLPSQAKARKVLDHDKIHGKPITAKQKRFFGHIAGGGKGKRSR
jgi:hypothetical protein